MKESHGFYSSIGKIFNEMPFSFNKIYTEKKPKVFDKYKSEIEKTKAYIESKREAFYVNNNIKRRW